MARDAAFEIGSTRVTTRLIEQEFPDYRKLLPEPFPNVLTASKEALLDGIRRVKLLARDSVPVRLTLSERLPSVHCPSAPLRAPCFASRTVARPFAPLRASVLHATTRGALPFRALARAVFRLWHPFAPLCASLARPRCAKSLPLNRVLSRLAGFMHIWPCAPFCALARSRVFLSRLLARAELRALRVFGCVSVPLRALARSRFYLARPCAAFYR